MLLSYKEKWHILYLIFVYMGLSNAYSSVGRRTEEQSRTPEESLSGINNCSSVMTLRTSGMECRYYIWDSSGTILDYARYYTKYYEGCYDTAECYFMEIIASEQTCNYTIAIDGSMVKTGIVANKAGWNGDFMRFGNCTAHNCAQTKSEVMLTSYLDWGAIDYSIHEVGTSEFKSNIKEGNLERICMDLKRCNIIMRDKYGWGTYYVYQNLIRKSAGNFQMSVILGQCPICPDMTLLVSTFDHEGGFQFTSTTKGHVISEYVPENDYKFVCIDSTICNQFIGTGNATYHLMKGDKVIDGGPATLITKHFFGTCDAICDHKPLLTSTDRGLKIILSLNTHSALQTLTNPDLPQYHAACWLINDDPRNLTVLDSNLVQRYIIALLYFSFNGWQWTSNQAFLSGKHECEWGAIKCVDGIVTKIDLNYNNMAGKYMSELYALHKLEYLDLSWNAITGTFHPGISKLKLTSLNLQHNGLEGSLPFDLFFLKNLTSIRLDRNLFTGSIPNAPPNSLTSIDQFLAFRNEFTGSIPNWICASKSISRIRLRENNFIGTLPNCFENFTKLSIIDIAYNRLSGTIYSDLLLLPMLRNIDMSHNLFTGTIHDSYSEPNYYVELHLQGNNLIGTIPSELSKLSNIQELNLQNNRLSGSFPQQLKSLQYLLVLQVENNLITGTIPFEDCSKFAFLSADTDVPMNISCKCCTREFGLFTTYEDSLDCPLDEIQLNFQNKINDKIHFYLENEAKQLISEKYEYVTEAAVSYKKCISITDCFTLTSNSYAKVNVLVNDAMVGLELPSNARTQFGYSSFNNTLELKSCDNYEICRRVVLPRTPQRKLVNLITKFSGIKVFKDESSIQFITMCWWLSDMEKKDYKTLSNTALVQRYLLALFYYSTKGAEWEKSDEWLSEVSECEWFGVQCEEIPGIVSGINLPANNLYGEIPTEIGYLKGLKTLILNSNYIHGSMPSGITMLQDLELMNLSNNKLSGSIVSQIKFLEYLRELDLGSNRFTNTIPSEIGGLRELVSVSFFNNSFSGQVPPEFFNLTNLETVSLSTNLFQGNFDLIRNLTKLRHLDLSDNYFSGNIPLYAQSMTLLEEINLSINKFSGTIISNIGEMRSLERLILYNNEITGSIPSQIGMLTKLSSLSLSYNNLKDGVPKELGNIKELKTLHLHRNQLVGPADHFDYKVDSFITDCGNTVTSDRLIQCEQCSECCNYLGDCIIQARIWPKKLFKDLTKLSPGLAIVFIMLSSWLILITTLLILRRKLPRVTVPVQSFQNESVYRFFLTTSVSSWVVATISVCFQVWVTFTFFGAGNFYSPASEWVYAVTCPDNSSECIDLKEISAGGWTLFYTILAFFLLPDVLDGFRLFYQSCLRLSKRGQFFLSLRGQFASIIVLSITILSIIASIVYIDATSISNADLLRDSVAILFLNELDEQMYKILTRIAPSWVEQLDNEIDEFLLKNSGSQNPALKSMERDLQMKEVTDDNNHQTHASMPSLHGVRVDNSLDITKYEHRQLPGYLQLGDRSAFSLEKDNMRASPLEEKKIDDNLRRNSQRSLNSINIEDFSSQKMNVLNNSSNPYLSNGSKFSYPNIEERDESKFSCKDPPNKLNKGATMRTPYLKFSKNGSVSSKIGKHKSKNNDDSENNDTDSVYTSGS